MPTNNRQGKQMKWLSHLILVSLRNVSKRKSQIKKKYMINMLSTEWFTMFLILLYRKVIWLHLNIPSFFNAFPCRLLSEWDHWWSWAFSHDLIDEERTAQLKLTEYIGGNWLKACRLLSKRAVLVKAHHAAEKYYVCIFSSWGIIKKFHIERNKLWFGIEKCKK